jgi:hypothetical protein
MKYEMLNNPALSHLRNLGVWFPGDPNPSREEGKEVMKFWGAIFGWAERSKSTQEQNERLKQARNLTEAVWFDLDPEFRVYLLGRYYWQNKKEAQRFYRQVQNLPGVTWRVIVHPRSGHKGYQFALGNTPQDRPTTPQGGTALPTVIDGLEDLL